MRERSASTLWPWLVAGFELGCLVGELGEHARFSADLAELRPSPDLHAAAGDDALVRAGPPDLAELSVRELRRLPGIGDRRANAIVELRWSVADVATAAPTARVPAARTGGSQASTPGAPVELGAGDPVALRATTRSALLPVVPSALPPVPPSALRPDLPSALRAVLPSTLRPAPTSALRPVLTSALRPFLTSALRPFLTSALRAGAAPHLTDVHGIGPRTAAKVAGWLERRAWPAEGGACRECEHCKDARAVRLLVGPRPLPVVDPRAAVRLPGAGSRAPPRGVR